MKRGPLVALGFGLALSAACAGGSSNSKAPASYSGGSKNTDTDDAPPPAMAQTTATSTAAPPSTPNDGDPSVRPYSGQATQPPNTHPGTAPVPPTPPNVGGTVDARRSWALATLGDSENQIQASMKECATACKALASMERAAKTLCDLGAPDECSRAKARVDAAREKVKKSCGSCPNGPSVIPGAPIPSVP